MSAYDAHVGWNEVTTDLGGGTLTGLSGYRIYYGTNPSVLSQVVDVGLTSTPSAPVYTVSVFTSEAIWYFVVTAYDASNNESPQSSTVSKYVKKAKNFAQRSVVLVR